MAAGSLPRPGTKYGPCKKVCAHQDCILTREMAAAPCAICGEAIGYDNGKYHSLFYDVTERKNIAFATPEGADKARVLAHADCAEIEVENNLKQLGR